MGIVAFILGRSGTGKSYSMRNFKPAELGVVNIQGKILPFRGSAKMDCINTDQSTEIMEAIRLHSKRYNSIVVDDFQYVMANEFMRRSSEKGYEKFTEIARHAWDIVNMVRELPADVIVYVMCHTDTDQDGTEKIKTIGKMLDEKICLEGMSTIVLKTNVSDGQYTFLTQNNGSDTVKSPAGMFSSYYIDNDLKYVDTKIRNYYGFDGAETDEEVAKMDEKVKTKTSDPREFELAMVVNGITMDQVQAFSEAKGNFPGIDPSEYPQTYKNALMKLDNIEKIKKFVKENENG